MRTQLLFVTISLGFFGCSTAQMAVDKNLVSKSDQYEISERPSAFSGDKLKFGPYRATEIDRSWINSSSSGMSISGVGSYSSSETGQGFVYNFKGHQHWTSKCEVKGGKSEVKRESSILSGVTYGENMGIFCSFTPGKENRRPANKGWEFAFKGQDLISAKGTFKVGLITARVVATNKFEGSPLPYGKPTGYYFYVGNKIVAGVDVINSKGPIWIEKKLNVEEKDAISLVAVALLLNQI